MKELVRFEGPTTLSSTVVYGSYTINENLGKLKRRPREVCEISNKNINKLKTDGRSNTPQVVPALDPIKYGPWFIHESAVEQLDFKSFHSRSLWELLSH